MESCFLAGISIIGGVMMAAVASASTITTYSDIAAFDAAHGPVTVETFTDGFYYPISSGILNSATTEAGLTAGQIKAGATYSMALSTGESFGIDEGGGFLGGVLDGRGDGVNDVLSIVFDGAVTGFSFVTNELMPTFDLTISFLNGQAYSGSFTVPTDDLTFFGFGSDVQDILSVTIGGTTNTGLSFILDDFRFGEIAAVSEVPLPAGLPVAVTAFATFGIVAGRRRQIAA